MSVILSTAYLPPLAYLVECLHTERVIIETFETYKKQTPRNHCLVYGPNGKQKLSIPVIKVNGNHTLTRDIRISSFQNWQTIHWRSIETAYNNSPYFLYYRDYFEPFYLKKFDFLLDFNTKLLEVLFVIFRIKKEIGFTDHFENPSVTPNNLLFPPYTQVFTAKSGFLPNLSIIDLIFNLGPDAVQYLSDSSFTADFTDYTDTRLNR
jgi:hypothetical protein